MRKVESSSYLGMQAEHSIDRPTKGGRESRIDSDTTLGVVNVTHLHWVSFYILHLTPNALQPKFDILQNFRRWLPLIELL